jgi:hypothetical protein
MDVFSGQSKASFVYEFDVGTGFQFFLDIPFITGAWAVKGLNITDNLSAVRQKNIRFSFFGRFRITK